MHNERVKALEEEHRLQQAVGGRDDDEHLTRGVMRPVATTTEQPRRDPAATREIFAHFEPRNSFEVPLGGADGSSSSSTSRRRNARWPAPRASDEPPVPPPAPSAFEEEVEPSHAFVLPRPPADSFGELRKALLRFPGLLVLDFEAHVQPTFEALGRLRAYFTSLGPPSSHPKRRDAYDGGGGPSGGEIRSGGKK